jgi:diguanylate cyclase (GGDEF)-like protein
MAQALARGNRGVSVAVLFADLDLFKQINDTRGHAAGDEVLRQVAERMVGAVRPEDTVARLGGDEFVAVCEGVDEVEAERMARDVRVRVGEPMVVDGTELVVGVSVGVHCSSGEDESPDSLLERADAEMYRHKRR